LTNADRAAQFRSIGAQYNEMAARFREAGDEGSAQQSERDAQSWIDEAASISPIPA